MKSLATADRLPTRAEQVALAKYVGWGGLSDVFKDAEAGKAGSSIAKVGAALRDILTPAEYATAKASTTDAHYTAEAVVRGMWGQAW